VFRLSMADEVHNLHTPYVLLNKSMELYSKLASILENVLVYDYTLLSSPGQRRVLFSVQSRIDALQ
jgi:hypothetical protein